MQNWKSGFIVLLLCVGLVLTACAADKKKEPAGSTSPTPEQTDQGAKETAKPAEPVKFSVFIAGSGGNPPQEEDPILQQLNKDLNMEMDFNIGITEYHQVLTARIAGGTPPDVFGVTQGTLKTFVEQDLLLDIGNYLDKLPNIKNAYTETDLKKGMFNGKMYALAKRPSIPMDSYWIRADWLKKLDMKVPTTLEEFKEVLVAFTEKDPDGNNKKDTYGLTGADLPAFNGIFSTFGIAPPGHWMIRDNKVVYSTTDPITKDALGFIAGLIKSGVVDPEIVTNQNPLDKAFKGQAGVIAINWSAIATEAAKKTYKDINANAEWIQLDALTGPGGKYFSIWDVGSSGPMIVLSKALEKEPEKLDKVLEYLNYITDPGKGQLTVNYGIEGKHFEMVDGKVKVLPAITETAYAWQVQLTGRNEMDYLKAKFPDQETEIDFAKNLPRINVYSSFVSLPEQVIADERYEYEELIKFMYDKRPLAEFDAYVEKLNSTFYLPERTQKAESELKALGYVK
ncbi:extracellular solute-binding protein [Paenibacillus eucommiae]|uniref:Aldouronate transport system substrate-binding protein n=1 Tax=Paenibacillus eucommiae TaxID=1355755 RepID=A0ABS4INI7_9BACL|nr:extracellular solute-binding protein [Paenibacillus eucommiae]MBP1989142.1 putative aldouronate transport system substrate-binding protein [Paenibacillus eucommiae]